MPLPHVDGRRDKHRNRRMDRWKDRQTSINIPTSRQTKADKQARQLCHTIELWHTKGMTYRKGTASVKKVRVRSRQQGVLTCNVCGSLQAGYASRGTEDDCKEPGHHCETKIGYAQAVALLCAHQHQSNPVQHYCWGVCCP